MPGPGELIAVMELEREQEQRVAASLTAAERETDGTLEQPSAKDRFAHAVGAKWHMHDALIAHRNRQEPPPAHDREAIFRANAGRPFEELENDAARVAEALVADVRALDATRLAAAPPWIHEATLADEVIQRFLGGGVRLFDGDGIASLGLEQVRVIEAPSVTHLTYRRVG